MSKNNELGKDAEILAVNYLKEKSYQILERNWRYGKKEVDIICKKDNVIVFVEVKFRSYESFGLPEEFVRADKRRHLIAAAEAYMERINELTELQFDIIAVSKDFKPSSILHIEDAFY